MSPNLENLIHSFDDGQGLPEPVFRATCGLVVEMMGDASEKVFRHYVELTEGRFYLQPRMVEGCLADMRRAAADPGK